MSGLRNEATAWHSRCTGGADVYAFFLWLNNAFTCFQLVPRTHGHRHTLCTMFDTRIHATRVCAHCTGSSCFRFKSWTEKCCAVAPATRPDEKRNVGAHQFFEGPRFKKMKHEKRKRHCQRMTLRFFVELIYSPLFFSSFFMFFFLLLFLHITLFLLFLIFVVCLPLLFLFPLFFL